jgi:hypothetical protein
MLFVSENIYQRTYVEQVKCSFEGVPILPKSPFNKIYETRAKFLEPDSVYEIDKLVNPNIETQSFLFNKL